MTSNKPAVFSGKEANNNDIPATNGYHPAGDGDSSTRCSTHTNGFHPSPDESSSSRCILVTGGAGYIGSHAVVELLQAGYLPVIVDNLANSNIECVLRLRQLTGREIPFHEIDIRDKVSLKQVFSKYKFAGVIHFAGMKAVGESWEIPLVYYDNNLTGSITLFQTMAEHGVKNLVFSSSCTVYGDPQCLPINESHLTGRCTNPYGRTKYFIEKILEDIATADKAWNVVILRYFNPIGAHDSGQIGEDPEGIPNCLMPYVAQVAVGRRAVLRVFGGDYETRDGTGVRDYIDVVELATGHVAALKQIEHNCQLKVYNLGTGVGYSVLDMVKAFEAASGKKIPYEIVARRPGDVATIYADASLATKEIGWNPQKDLRAMCEGLWRWQSQNPTGYRTD
jgi:UDP-glucose 4-epimerase